MSHWRVCIYVDDARQGGARAPGGLVSRRSHWNRRSVAFAGGVWISAILQFSLAASRLRRRRCDASISAASEAAADLCRSVIGPVRGTPLYTLARLCSFHQDGVRVRRRRTSLHYLVCQPRVMRASGSAVKVAATQRRRRRSLRGRDFERF